MFIKRFFSVILILTTVVLSCSKDSKPAAQNQILKKAAPENLKKIEVEIKGMTCEIGCARIIESKLSKTKGVKFVDVIFKKNLGKIEYDSNILDKKQIARVIKDIAGGGLYEVVNTREVKYFSELP